MITSVILITMINTNLVYIIDNPSTIPPICIGITLILSMIFFFKINIQYNIAIMMILHTTVSTSPCLHSENSSVEALLRFDR